MCFTILHLNVTTLDSLVLYSISAKVRTIPLCILHTYICVCVGVRGKGGAGVVLGGGGAGGCLVYILWRGNKTETVEK